MKIYYLSGYVTRESYLDFCKKNKLSPEKTVFVFAGNTGHMARNCNLSEPVSGGGLAAAARSITGTKDKQKRGQQGYPVFGLVTTGIHNSSTFGDDMRNCKQSIQELFEIAGQGYNIVIPVREFCSVKKVAGKNIQGRFFEEPITVIDGKGYELSLWGNIDPSQPKDVEKYTSYYSKNIKKLEHILLGRENLDLSDFEFELKNAFHRGKKIALDLCQKDSQAHSFKWVNNNIIDLAHGIASDIKSSELCHNELSDMKSEFLIQFKTMLHSRSEGMLLVKLIDLYQDVKGARADKSHPLHWICQEQGIHKLSGSGRTKTWQLILHLIKEQMIEKIKLAESTALSTVMLTEIEVAKAILAEHNGRFGTHIGQTAAESAYLLFEKNKLDEVSSERSRPPSSEVQHYSILSRHQIL
ncbi:hypothetical protein [Piscirickettsia salmonis]|uniref:hypothetical protein n=1 Tax=Piscirickettsia salmonis TaxID=1238 RepID=UPI003A7F8091